MQIYDQLSLTGVVFHTTHAWPPVMIWILSSLGLGYLGYLGLSYIQYYKLWSADTWCFEGVQV